MTPPRSKRTRSRIHEGAAFSGFLLGLIIGGLTTLFRGPRIRLHTLRPPSGDAIRSVTEKLKPHDTLQQSIEEAKQTARRRARR